MAKFCSNCGAQLDEAAKFCPGCGTQTVAAGAQTVAAGAQQIQAQQPYAPQPVQPAPLYSPPSAPAPAAPKKKNKTLFIIAGAAVAVVALVVALIVALSGKSGGNGGGVNASSGSGDVQVNVPKDATDEEKLAYNYIETAAEFFKNAAESDKVGLPHCADGACSVAAVSVCSMRYAVDCLLEMKGVAPAEDGRLRDWDAIAALGWVSPFPYFFEGVVLEAKGDSAGAAECYRKAALNPNFLEGMESNKTIKNLDEKALKGLQATLEELEDKIFAAAYGPCSVNIPRDENNFSVDYLRKKAQACLEAEEEDLFGAYEYFSAALQINPLDGDNYANAAIVALYMDDGDMFLGYLNEGLMVDPNNARLKFLQNTMKEATGR